jgi:hypothetical protein
LCGYFFRNTRRKLELHAQALPPKPQPPEVLFCLLANEARTKKIEGRAQVVQGHMGNPWHRLRPFPASHFAVCHRNLIEVPGPLTAEPIVARRSMLCPLRRCALRVLNRGSQADARPAVRARASTLKKDAFIKVSGARQNPAAIPDNARGAKLTIFSARGLT